MDEEGGAGGALYGEEAAAGGADVYETATDAEEGAIDGAPPWLRANSLYLAWDLSAVGLMLKTIPFPQWPFCAQNIQTGSVFMTWNFIVGGGLTVLLGIGINPESMPPAIFIHGSLKVD